ncbi:N-methyl-L-tryptophan oxidase [Rosenbergiella australiborealis]|uniref:N-methyl-L-tryptophan oxidase n=1 Tax=Rosenbergiella australiborealis TaxID=1544696 RepID=A0ABS5T585_9GAMM|nr:N-methyl-L-tryptophan oxidase [Rosenbergiella australiborealis]MBT0726645.1 N-methyl-L-tryptophan oxidase [Rosenbergiella australiborealis]
MIYDVIIVGSGSVGAAAGCYATINNLNVLMIDAHHPPHHHGSHHGKTRLIRYAYAEGDQYLPLLQRSKVLWEALEKTTGTSLLTPCGVLSLAPVDSPLIPTLIECAKTWSVDVEPLSASEIMQRWATFVVPENYHGVLDKNAGYLYSEKAVEQWIRLAQEQGCAQLFNCSVNEISHYDDLYRVSTADGEYTARKIIVTAGSWVKKLHPNIPISPVRKVMTWFQSDGRFSQHANFPAFTAQLTDGSQYYGFPAEDDQLKVARHDGGQPLNDAAECLPFGQYPTDGSECFSFLKQFLPGQSACLYGLACSYDNSPDGHFIIDYLDNDKTGLIISGLSGHGFKCAPALGEIASQFALGNEVDTVIEPFRLKRFEKNC